MFCVNTTYIVVDIEIRARILIVMADSDSDEPPSLVFSSESDEDDNDYHLELVNREPSWIRRFQDIIRIRTLAPFLFAGQFGSDFWTTLMINIGFLHREWLASNEVASCDLSKAVDMMENIAQCVIETLINANMRIMAHDLLDSLSGKKTIDDVLPAASENNLIFQLREKLTKQPEDSDKDKVTVALLYACHQYDTFLLESRKSDVVTEFDKEVEKEDKSIESLKAKGNNEFKNHEFVKSVGFYTAALTKSRFNYVLYANRSQAYLKLSGNNWLALVDAKRSIILNGEYLKAHHRYVMAWQNLNKTECALDALSVARQLDMSDSDRALTNNWIKKMENELERRDQATCDMGVEIKPVPLTPAPKFTESVRSDYSTVMKENIEPVDENNENRLREVGKTIRQSVGKAYECHSTATSGNMTASEATCSKVPKKPKVKKTKEPINAPSSQKTVSGSCDLLGDIYATAIKGSHFFLENKMSSAVEAYRHVNQLMTNIDDQDKDVFDDSDQAILLYALATALMKSGSKKNIADAIKIYHDIVTTYKSVKIPVVYLRLGIAYFLQARFAESESMLYCGLKQSHQQKVFNWPGTNKAISLTKEANLKEELNYWTISCHNPPPPIAKCRVVRGPGHMNINIYLEDPDFKGFVRVMCYLKCYMEYHLDCWKKRIIDDFNQCSDKQLINAKCFTPDCESLIKSIKFYDTDGNEKRRVEGSKPERLAAEEKIPKQCVKMGKSERKLKAVLERKLRKQKRKQEARETKLREEEDAKKANRVDRVESSQKKTTGAYVPDEPMLLHGDDIVKYATVLKKEDSPSKQNLENPAMRKKKKKDRQKKAMTLGEFVGNKDEDEDEEYLVWEAEPEYNGSSPPGVDAAMGIDNFTLPSMTRTYPMLDPVNPFTVPECLRENMDTFEKSLEHYLPKPRLRPPLFDNLETVTKPTNHNSSTSIESEPGLESTSINDFLYSFFHDILARHGPLNVDDLNITRELEEFPPDALDVINTAGGIGQFLSHNIQFTMVGDVVCLIQDEPKARVIGQENKKSLVEKYRQEIARSMGTLPCKSRKRKKKGGNRAMDFEDIPRSVDLRDEDLLSEKSWQGSEYSNQSETSTASKGSKYNQILDVNDLLTSHTSVSSPLSHIALGLNKDDYIGAVDSAKCGHLNMEDDNSPIRNSRDWTLNVNGVGKKLGDHLASQSVNSISNGFKTDYFLDNNAIEDRTSMLDSISDDDNSSHQSDASSMTNKHDADLDQQDDGLEISSVAIATTYRNRSGEDNMADLFNEPIDLLTTMTMPKKKNKIRKKRNGTKVNPNLKDKNETEISQASGQLDKRLTDIKSDSKQKVLVLSSETPSAKMVSSETPSTTMVSSETPCTTMASSKTLASAPKMAQIVPSPNPQIVDPSQFLLPQQITAHLEGSSLPLVSCTEDTDVSSMSHQHITATSISGTHFQATQSNNVSSPNQEPTLPLGALLHTKQSSPASSLPSVITRHQPVAPPVIYDANPNIQGHVFNSSKLIGAPIMMQPSDHMTSKPSVILRTSIPPNIHPVTYQMPKATQPATMHLPSSMHIQGPPPMMMPPPLNMRPCVTAKDAATNTEPTVFDWSEVEVLMIQLEKEKYHLAETLEKERKARMVLAQEQGEQMEQLVTQLANQSVENADVKAILLSERDEHIAEIARLQDKINCQCKLINELQSHTKSLQANKADQSTETSRLAEELHQERNAREQDQEEHFNIVKILSEKYRMDMLRAEKAEVDFLNLKLEMILKPFNETAQEAERNMLYYANIIQTLTDDGLGAPTELMAVCQIWNTRCQEVKDACLLAEKTVQEHIRHVKSGKPLTSLPVLQFPDVPQLPSRPEQHCSPAHSDIAHRTVGFNAAPSRPTSMMHGNQGAPVHLMMAGKSEPKKNSFDKIMQSLTAMFPNYRGTDIKQFILRLRESRGGTLSGLHLQEIVTRVAERIVEDSRRRITSAGQITTASGVTIETDQDVSFLAPSATPWTPRANLSASAVTEEEIFEEEEDPCVICHEELKHHKQISGDCGHSFHDSCIRRWLKEQSTCPTCRTHFLLQDDFPALK